MLFIVLGSRMVTPMLLRIDNLMLLLSRRVVDLMLLLSWRIIIVFMLSMDLMFLSRVRRRLSILTRNLTMHTCLINSFLSFVAK